MSENYIRRTIRVVQHHTVEITCIAPDDATAPEIARMLARADTEWTFPNSVRCDEVRSLADGALFVQTDKDAFDGAQFTAADLAKLREG